VESPREADLLDLDAYLYGDGISVIEWAERAAGLLPPGTRRVSFQIHEDLTRTIVLDDSDDAGAGETASRSGADA
jgi:tRNA A37 threonylcarbamoyladenosine biosynthesis protein TsaE